MREAELYYPRALGYLTARIQIAVSDLESPDANPEKTVAFLRQSLERLDAEKHAAERGKEAFR